MIRKAASVFFAFVLLFSLMPAPALAVVDKTPPVISDISVSKTFLNVGDVVTITVKATDSSGIESCWLYIDEISYWWGTNIEMKRVSGKPGYFSCSYRIPQEMYDGFYNLHFMAIDTYNNSQNYYSEGFKVSNPGNVFEYAVPKLTSFVFDQTSYKGGEDFTFSCNIDLNGLKCNASGLDELALQFYVDKVNLYTLYEMPLEKVEDGVYSGSFWIPPSWAEKKIIVRRVSVKLGPYIDIEWPKPYRNSDGNAANVGFGISSVFTGMSSTSVRVGSSFNALSGVSAINRSEGDMTKKIEVTGTVDTNKVGVYLLKYRVHSSIRDNLGKYSYYYYDYRWVGVTDVLPNSNAPAGTLLLTKNAAYIGVSSADATLTRNGAPITFLHNAVDAGNYVITGKDAAAGKTLFSIDKSAPNLTASWVYSTPNRIVVTAKRTDIAGNSQMKWERGSVSLAEIKAHGTAFTQSFAIGTPGLVTLYASDRLGNECIKVIRIDPLPATGVSLNAASKVIARGGSFQLVATVSPANATDQTVTWSTSNARVVLVDATGKVKAVSPGVAVITVRTANGMIARCSIIVK